MRIKHKIIKSKRFSIYNITAASRAIFFITFGIAPLDHAYSELLAKSHGQILAVKISLYLTLDIGRSRGGNQTSLITYITLTILVSKDFCHLLITFANSKDPDLEREECRSWSWSKRIDTLIVCSWKNLLKKVIFTKKSQQTTKKFKEKDLSNSIVLL